VKFLVDANVISETTKSNPSLKVKAWLRAYEADLVVDAVVLGEVPYGILLLPSGTRKRELEKWFDQVVATMAFLPWGAATALRWAELLADLRRRGKTLPIKDSMIAASALVHDLTVATRNTRDFAAIGLKVTNPFE
jgi:predicted nucleic acid-binding protein